jgi:crossover junction endodeoxyribonuclease RusA
MTVHTFTVPGVPRPQGSKRGIVNRWSGKVAMVEQSTKVGPWRESIGKIARSEIGVRITGPVTIEAAFVFRPPVKSGRVGPHTQTPDLDKLLRAVLDALTGIAFEDDKQVACLVGRKRWGSEEGVQITVGEWDLLDVSLHREAIPIGV